MEVLRRRSPPRPPVSLAGRPAPSAERALPPRVPEQLAELDEALMLLGNYVQAVQAGGKLKESLRLRLQVLIGGVPELAVAKAWKSGLKELRGEVAELEQRKP
jgi:hypothetical protein